MKRIFVKQYGIQRSGTNYVQWLLENNFNVEIFHYQLGSKHADHPKQIDWKHQKGWKNNGVDVKTKSEVIQAIRNQTMRYIITIKDPYAWIVSYRRWKKRIYGTQKHLDSKTLIAIWNNRYTNWQQLIEYYNLATFVKYEDLLAALYNELDIICKTLQLTKLESNIGYVNMERSFLESPTLSNNRFNPNYYLDKQYLSDLSRQDLVNCKNLLSKKLMRFFGYKYENIS